jgi:hypothetical protein
VNLSDDEFADLGAPYRAQDKYWWCDRGNPSAAASDATACGLSGTAADMSTSR